MLCPVVDDPLYKQKRSDNNLFSYKPKAFFGSVIVTRQFPVNQSLPIACAVHDHMETMPQNNANWRV